jgi:hypothetical protein
MPEVSNIRSEIKNFRTDKRRGSIYTRDDRIATFEFSCDRVTGYANEVFFQLFQNSQFDHLNPGITYIERFKFIIADNDVFFDARDFLVFINDKAGEGF